MNTYDVIIGLLLLRWLTMHRSAAAAAVTQALPGRTAAAPAPARKKRLSF